MRARLALRLALSVGVLGLLVGPPTAVGQVSGGLVQSHVRKVVVELPEGMSISPSAANGLRACGDDELNLRSSAPAECPDASKIGVVEILSPVLEVPLQGGIYVREQTPRQLFRLALTASAPSEGVHIKLPGVALLDPATGQVTTIFDELPQLPFSDMSLRFFGGPGAALANPLDCGTYGVRSVLSPWSGTEPVTELSVFDVSLGEGRACPRVLPFDPIVRAGTVNPVAGAASAFVLRVRRDDRRQELRRVSVELPAGVAASVKGVSLCPSARARAGACGEGSRVGSATVGAGPGPRPLYLRGPVYLTEGYRGAQFGLAVVVQAVAGPFDLGTVVVRAAVHLDPETARLRVEADPFPRILRGVPLRLRDIHLAIDRPGFIRNPTSCAEKRIQTSVEAFQGAVVEPASRFQVGNCAALGFAPRMRVALTGRRARRGARLGLRTHLRARAGQANLRAVALRLPPEVALDLTRGGPGICTRGQFAADACPPRSRVGRARAITPLLDRPLRGPVHFVQGDPFPKLAMRLTGEIEFKVLGSTGLTRRGVVARFSGLPDVPVTDFRVGLRRGTFTVTRNLCARRSRVALGMAGQNGRRAFRRLRLVMPCGRPPRLRLRRAVLRGDTLTVRGSVRRRARRRVVVAVRCGPTVRRRRVRVRRGRWVTRFELDRRCRRAGRARVRARYSGDRVLSAQVRSGRVRRARVR